MVNSLRPMKLPKFQSRYAGWPMMAFIKYDGVRLRIMLDGSVVTKSGKPVPNTYIKNQILGAAQGTLGIEGEVVCVNDDGSYADINTTSGWFRKLGHHPCKFVFIIFDAFGNPDTPFSERYMDRLSEFNLLGSGVDEPTCIRIPEGTFVTSEDQMLTMYNRALERGHEGLILRKLSAPYKFGDVTPMQAHGFKVKPWPDSEAKIVGFIEGFRNENPSHINSHGRRVRGTKKEFMVPNGKLGALELDWNGIRVTCSGGTAEQKAEIWANQDKYLGKLAKFSYQGTFSGGTPRHPQFIGIRDAFDMDGETS